MIGKTSMACNVLVVDSANRAWHRKVRTVSPINYRNPSRILRNMWWECLVSLTSRCEDTPRALTLEIELCLFPVEDLNWPFTGRFCWHQCFANTNLWSINSIDNLPRSTEGKLQRCVSAALSIQDAALQALQHNPEPSAAQPRVLARKIPSSPALAVRRNGCDDCQSRWIPTEMLVRGPSHHDVCSWWKASSPPRLFLPGCAMLDIHVGKYSNCGPCRIHHWELDGLNQPCLHLWTEVSVHVSDDGFSTAFIPDACAMSHISLQH
jgi:hypothetical protein